MRGVGNGPDYTRGGTVGSFNGVRGHYDGEGRGKIEIG